MLQLKSFKPGGIHPPQQKLSAGAAITWGAVPKQLLIPVQQHIGKPCKVLVNKGDAVKRGDLLAESTGFISSNVHAPLDGKVQKIMRFPLLGGQVRDVIQLTCNDAGTPYREIVEKDYNDQPVDIDALDASEIRKKIAAAGIVGMGGAGFPTHVKLTPPDGKKIDTLLINGAECEPYITADHRLMLEYSREIIQGTRLLQRLFDGVPVFIGIEDNKPDALRAMDEAAKEADMIDVVPLKTQYPQGGEKQLIKAILGREVPSKGLPMDVGVVVQNVATVLAIRNAVYFDRPLTERVVTVSGNLVGQPGNIVLPIGTPVSTVMEQFDIDPARVRLFISGGPMMGRTSYSFESPVSKTTSALLFFDETAVVKREENPCIRCGNCINACPMGLAVARLTEMIIANGIDPAAKEAVLDCIECGSCSYVCPADRRLVHWMRLGKNIIRREN
ncbi:MAG TPA: electron transport complex subunit RsxC [Caldithrix abyssi]|uniref:Ion-translocating oxidoreductase complex subunit C n=1 Tax=Caldithrix abyssi TaxID=187145 RepID=A0A7V4U343_CALAY|nr:electron transport complex subunit RsxC [Caldithrix abyssi]